VGLNVVKGTNIIEGVTVSAYFGGTLIPYICLVYLVLGVCFLKVIKGGVLPTLG